MTAVILSFVVLFQVASPARPEAPVSTFRGRITDSSGGVIPGVEVTLTSAFIERRVVTNATGEFQIALPHAWYELKAVLAGFRTIEESVWISSDRRPSVWQAQMRLGRLAGGDPVALEQEIARRAGRDAVSCGVFGPPETEARLIEALACVTNAAVAGQTAWARVGLWRMDGFAAVGVVAAKDGNLYLFRADEFRSDFTACPLPKVVSGERQWQFGCAAK